MEDSGRSATTTTTLASSTAVLVISNKLICLPTNGSLHPTVHIVAVGNASEELDRSE